MVGVVLSSVGGVIALVGMVVVLGRGIFRQVDSTERNTLAITELTEVVGKMRDQMNTDHARTEILWENRHRS